MDPKDIQSVSVVPADGTIAVNGESYSGCDVAVDPHDRYGPVHAIQWWGDHGNIEHGRGPAIGFTDIERVLEFIPAWLERRAEVLADHATHLATQLKNALGNVDGHKAALADLEKQLKEEAETMKVSEKTRLERVRDETKARIEHFVGLHGALTEQHAVAAEKAAQAKDAAA